MGRPQSNHRELIEVLEQIVIALQDHDIGIAQIVLALQDQTALSREMLELSRQQLKLSQATAKASRDMEAVLKRSL